MSETKQLYKLEDARKVAEELSFMFEDSCCLLKIAGSIRRKKPNVGDIEIVYVPLVTEGFIDGELNIHPSKINKTEEKIQELITNKTLCYRFKKNGTKSFGERVKLLKHIKSGIPIDLFSCTIQEWSNNLVSRTGGKQTNITIASHAKRMGWNWLPFNIGFKHKKTQEIFQTKSERDVFDFVNLPYLEPWERP